MAKGRNCIADDRVNHRFLGRDETGGQYVAREAFPVICRCALRCDALAYGQCYLRRMRESSELESARNGSLGIPPACLELRLQKSWAFLWDGCFYHDCVPRQHVSTDYSCSMA
jgi:hypothetical protein